VKRWIAALIALASTALALAGPSRYLPRAITQSGEYRRYDFSAMFHGERARVGLEMWEGSQEFLGSIETVNAQGQLGEVQLYVSGNYHRNGDILIFETGYANSVVRAREASDGTLTPLDSNVPFEVLDASVQLAERRAATPTPSPRPPKRK